MEEVNKLVQKNRIIGIIDINYLAVDPLFNTVKEELLATKRSVKKIIDALKMVGLNKEILNCSFAEISASEQTKVLTAKALLTRSNTIILNDPTNKIDSFSKEKLSKLIKLMKLRYGKSIIIFSDDTDFLHKVVDYVIIMNDGNILLQGSKYEVFAAEEILNKYYIKIPKIMAFSKIVKAKQKINIGFRDDTSDLMKDIYRFATESKE